MEVAWQVGNVQAVSCFNTEWLSRSHILKTAVVQVAIAEGDNAAEMILLQKSGSSLIIFP